MSDNLPKDPPDQNNNPVDPNNPYASQPPQNLTPDLPEHPEHSIHSEVAQHRPRDAHGHFLPYEHPNLPQPPPAPQTAPSPPNPSAPSNPSSFLPPIIEVNKETKSSQKDPPLFGFF